MDSRRWLIALGALAALLAAVLVVDLARGGAPVRGGRIFPDWSPASVRAVRIEHRGRRALVVAREGTGWRIREPLVALADPSAVADLLGTLEIMAARRHDDGQVSDPVLTVRVERSGAPSVTLDLARDAGATDRVWLSRRGEARRALVDGYLVRALDLEVDDLREHRPFRGRLAGATRIAVAAGPSSTVLAGPPWRIGGVRADPDKVAVLVAALERLRATSFLEHAPAGEASASVAVIATGGPADVVARGRCEDAAALASTTPIGPACLPADEMDAITSLALGEGALVDRRLLAASPAQVSRATIIAGNRSITIDRAEQAEVVRAWAARFADAGGAMVTASGLPATGRVEVDVEGGREEIDVVRAPGGRLAARRAGEPVAFVLEDAAAVDPSPQNFRSLDLIAADPTSLMSARRGGEHIERGELLEEWRALAPRGATVDTAAAEALAATIASLRAVRVAADQSRRASRTITVELAPPPGESAPIRHRIDVARGAGGACTVRLDGDPTAFELAPEACAALVRPWTRR